MKRAKIFFKDFNGNLFELDSKSLSGVGYFVNRDGRRGKVFTLEIFTTLDELEKYKQIGYVEFISRLARLYRVNVDEMEAIRDYLQS